MARSSWKRVEREIAQRVGGKRVPVSGRARGDAPDVEHPRLAIEVKHRQKLPEWLLDALDQAEKSAILDQIPVVVLHEAGQRYDDSLVLLRLEKLLQLLCGIGSGGGECPLVRSVAPAAERSG
jgi:hypothetical protein